MTTHQKPRTFLIPHSIGCAIVASFLLMGCAEEREPTGIAGALQAVAGSDGDDHSNGDHSNQSAKPRPIPSEKPPWPTATVEESEFHFGRMQLGAENGEHKFTITNTGDTELELVAGDPTCQCTTFELSTENLAPGESATLTVRWQAAKVDPNFSHGGGVYTNDPKRREIRFNITGMIDANITMKPSGLWHAGTLGDEPITFEADVFSRILDELTITSAEMQSQYSSVKWTPLRPIELSQHDAVSGYRFVITVEPDFPVGKLEDLLTIDAEQLSEPLKIPVHANRQGAIHITGMNGARFNSTLRGLDLGRFPAYKGRKAQLMLIVQQKDFDEELRLVETECEPKFLRVSLEPIGESSGNVRRYAMTVEMPPGAPRTKRLVGNSGTIHCETNHPTGENIDLMVRIDSF